MSSCGEIDDKIDLGNYPDDVRFSPAAEKVELKKPLLNPPVDYEGNAGKKNESVKKVKEKKKEIAPMVSMATLFRYSTGLDKLLIAIGTLCAIAHGVLNPLQFLIFGDLVTVFSGYFKNLASNVTLDQDQLEDKITTFSIYYVYLAAAALVVCYGQMGFWSLTAARQTKQLKLHFFRAILKQDISWFDCNDPGELNTRLTDDLNKVYDGIGHKFALFVQAITVFITGIVLAFVYGWQLTLVMLSVSPLMAIFSAIVTKIFIGLTSKAMDSYAKAGSIAEEVLSSIHTVASFGGETKEYNRFNSHLTEARDFGVRSGLISGLGMGIFQIIVFGSYSLAFWYGSTLIIDKAMEEGDILIVFFSVMIGAIQLGQAGTYYGSISTARAAGYKVFKVIDRVSPIDASLDEGIKPEEVTGEIEFHNVEFAYPSRKNVTVLREFNLTIKRGTTVALVGESGCGKSTVIKLIQRFYDPVKGEVLLDGHDIRSLNLAWLRQHTGIVSQEPVLFATTIAENIRYGKEDITDEDIEKACQMANCHELITNLPEGYKTLVGERGAQLSGGQKQRIAIARALVRDPKILLLDEATSALDSESETAVQTALDKAREGRTTIVIAHRLSTIKNADVIVVFQDGAIVERGNHSELMEMNGVYRQLVILQTLEEETPDDPEKDTTFALRMLRDDHELSVEATKRHSSRKQTSAFDKQQSVAGGKSKGELMAETVEPAPLKRILKLVSSDWPLITLGSFGAMVKGAHPLMFALLLSEVLTTFTQKNKEKMKEDSTFWSLMFLVLGAVLFLASVAENWAFAKSGELLTLRLRQRAFKSLLRQSMSYFDDPAHSTGALCTMLATHASDVKGATGAQLGTVATTLTTVVSSLVFAFAYEWRLTLVILAFFPFMAITSYFQMKIFIYGSKGEELLDSGKVAVEAVENIRTIVSLGIEKTFYEKYEETVAEPHKKAQKRAHFYGLSFGMHEAIALLCCGAAFRFGAFLIAKHGLDFGAMIKVIMCVMICSMMVGRLSAFSPDYAKARIAAARLFKLFDSISPIDSSSEHGLRPNSCEGTVLIENVKFHYPTRPDVQVLKDLNLTVTPGQRIALVGPSGCGKSTVVALLERFYDVNKGQVAIDYNDVKSLNIKWLRSRMGVVSQEPILFNYSIAENIAYGDNSRMVYMEEIEKAAKAANIHSYINSLPKGYDTNVGDKGTLISGGQKQRIAIARALIGNPRILILDEATSALDTESEKAVQEALDKASKGRTTIIIAHRLSTVQTADSIAVIEHGRVVEQGTHQELLALKGTYHSLVIKQLVAADERRERSLEHD